MITPLIGNSKSIVGINKLIKHAATNCLNVLITGEAGVGKEVVAQNLYTESIRATKNFIKINCAILPETLLERELFGYEKGAFTGAEKKRFGKFQTADKGVLFLDEIGNIPMPLQSKILRVLKSGEFSPIGSDRVSKFDVWLIATTNQDLKKKIAKRTSLEDLFYRLNIINIHIPPLRERKDDIPVLIESFLRSDRLKYPPSIYHEPDSQTLAKLCYYPWPGNVRQLKDSVKKLMAFNSWEKILEGLPTDDPGTSLNVNGDRQSKIAKWVANDSTRIIPPFIDKSTSTDTIFEDISLKKINNLDCGGMEKEVIAFVLEKVGWNRSHAAKILKISYKALLYKMEEFEVNSSLEDKTPNRGLRRN